MIMLDSNIIVYAYNRDAPERQYCLPVIRNAILGKLDAALSVLSLFEVYHVLAQRIQRPLPESQVSQIMLDLALCRNIRKFDITESLFIEAITVAEEYSIKINDALVASTMRSIGSEEIYSHDSDFDKVEFIRRVDPIPV